MTDQSSPKRVAVIMGDEDLLGLIRTILLSDGLTIASAAAGRAGLELVQREAVDLIILDLALPDMNGWEFYLQLQAQAGTALPPVIILASQASRVDRNFGMRVAQVHDYLIKPFLPSQLRRSVAAALKAASGPAYRRDIAEYPA